MKCVLVQSYIVKLRMFTSVDTLADKYCFIEDLYKHVVLFAYIRCLCLKYALGIQCNNNYSTFSLLSNLSLSLSPFLSLSHEKQLVRAYIY